MPERPSFGVEQHPDAETLAAYVDGVLDDRTHAVERHIGACGDCYDLVTEVTRANGLDAEPAASRRWRVWAAGLVAAAIARRCGWG